MQPNEIHQFLERFFKATDCQIDSPSDGALAIQLTVDMDKALMNRPFYWHYLEKTGGTPAPMNVTFITDAKLRDEGMKGEWIHFGSPRLHQLLDKTKVLSRFMKLYERKETFQLRQRGLQPWLIVNISLTYQCDKKREEIHSIGISLINGQMKNEMMEYIKDRQFSPSIPDYCFTLSPLIMPTSALGRIYSYLENMIKQEDDAWAVEAKKRWEEDLALLDAFYEGLEEIPETFHVEKEALRQQYEPVVNCQVINGGIFYLDV